MGVWYAQNVQNPQTLLSDAQSCIYRSTAKVFKEVDGQLFPVSETIPPGPMEVTNDRNDVLALEAGGFSQASYNTESMVFDPGRVRNYARGDRASVTLSKIDVSEWRVGSVFCKQQNGSTVGCPTEGALNLINQRIQSGQSDGRTIPAFTVDCGVDVEYGWILARMSDDPTPSVSEPTDIPPSETPSPSPSLGDSCSYKTKVHVYEDQRDDNSYVSADAMSSGVMKITNDRGQALDLNDDGVARAGYETDNLLFDPTREREYAENDPATVTLSNIDTEYWKVKEVFCDQADGSTRGCPTESDISQLNSAIATGADSGLALGEFRVNCGVDLDYGWVLERTSNPTGNGDMEIKVVALNYPEKTSIWPEDHLANSEPVSCSRQSSDEESRPLYLSSFEMRATCVGGGCEVGKQYENDAKKREGYVNIKDMPAGQYTLEIRDMADADDDKDSGYRVWSGCQDKVWTVSPDANNTQAVVILENIKGNRYERRSTEKLCKDDGGIPNLIAGIDGNVCHLTGASDDDDDKKDDGNPDELTVKVKNTIGSVTNATVQLSPCPPSGPCELGVAFNGQTTESVTFDSGKDSVHEIRIRNITSDSRTFSLIPVAVAQENGNARVVEGCSNGVVFPDGNEDELCKTSAPDSIGFAIVSANSSRDEIPRRGDPDVVAEQPGDASDVFFGSCPVFASGKCSPAYLRRTFTDASDVELQKLSAICFRESSGSNVALNDSCLTGGRDMSAGLFQINTWVGGECVNVVDPATHGGARCQIRPGETRECILALYNPDTNISRAKGKWDASRSCKDNPFCPWRAGASERCRLADYGDTYKNCNLRKCL